MPDRGRATVLLVGLEVEENLAIRYLAAILESRGHRAVIAPCSTTDDFPSVLALVRKKRPTVVAISMAFQSLAPMFFDLVGQIRQAGFDGHVIAGGHFATFEFERILQSQPGIDSVGRFEGEETLVRLADALVAGTGLDNVPNLVHRDGDHLTENACVHRFPDLETLPYPVRAKGQRRLGEHFATLIASRGCWHSACLYCCIGAFHRPKTAKFAIRSADSVAREIAELLDSRGDRVFQFHDDNFMLATRDATLRRMEDLARALRDAGVDCRKIAFIIKARPDVVDDAVADALVDLGCTGAFLGIENACEAGLAALIRSATPDHVQRSLGVLTAHDIAVTYNLLIFHPKATLDEFDANIGFVRNNLAIPFDFGRAEIVAGSPLERLVIDCGLLQGTWPLWDYRLQDPTMNEVWQACRNSFRAPEVPYANAIHIAIALAYHAAVVKRLYPGPVSEEFAANAAVLISRWNAATVESMEGLKGIALDHHSEADMQTLCGKIAEDAASMQTASWLLIKSLARYQTCRRIFRFFGVENAIDQGLPARLLKW